MKLNRLVDFQGKQMHASDIARSIRPDIRKAIEWSGKKPWYFTKSCWIPKVDRKGREVILWKRKNDENAAKILIIQSNRKSDAHKAFTRNIGAILKHFTGMGNNKAMCEFFKDLS